jgi:regulation of enolase protein 1 (concanavalin A-like superfamily)
MKKTMRVLALSFLFACSMTAQEVVFEDGFIGRLRDGWKWIREDSKAWRATSQGLEVRIQAGNLWGSGNDAKNVLVRPAPDISRDELIVSVTVTNKPSNQYEQAGLAWYYDDRHMVKLVKEQVDGRLLVVMGREEADRPASVGMQPLEGDTVRLRFRVFGNRITGQFCPDGSTTWTDVGTCQVPAPADGRAQLSLQCYNGPISTEHWVRFSDFRVERVAR